MNHNTDDMDWIHSFYASAVEWWGESWYEGENLQPRLELIENYGSIDKAGLHEERILELGAGTGETAAFLCDHGYSVTAVDLCRKNIELLNNMKKTRTNLEVVEGDYLTVTIEGKYAAICMFESFGMGSDHSQRELLKRISFEWLKNDGAAIIDVYHPYGPIKDAGTSRYLEKLEEVPGSVDMTEYCYYDGIKNRWIDIWEPVNNKTQSRTQSIRCYTPSDLMLILEGTGLYIEEILFNGRKIDFSSEEINRNNPFEESDRNYSYTVILRKHTI